MIYTPRSGEIIRLSTDGVLDVKDRTPADGRIYGNTAHGAEGRLTELVSRIRWGEKGLKKMEIKLKIEIPDEEIKEEIKRRIVEKIMGDNRWNTDKRIFRKEYGEIIKEMIYRKDIKEDIINRTVNVAADEIRRKAMPILSERLFGGTEK